MAKKKYPGFVDYPEWDQLCGENKERYRSKVQNLVDTIESINPEGFTILTGSNGGGKSLIREQFAIRYQKHDDSNPTHRKCKSISMQLRTSTNPMWGALASAMLDNEWTPTSLNTFKLINGVFNAAGIYEEPESGMCSELSETGYIIIDEPEIGMDEEMVYALGEWLFGILPLLKKAKIGLMIITHSRILIDLLYELTLMETDISFDFKNLDGLNIEQYLNREIKKADLGLLEANYLFFAVRERMHEVKESEKTKGE